MAGDTLSSISDLLGLNSPRGLLNFGNSSNGLWTPPASSAGFQVRIILNFNATDILHVYFTSLLIMSLLIFVEQLWLQICCQNGD